MRFQAWKDQHPCKLISYCYNSQVSPITMFDCIRPNERNAMYLDQQNLAHDTRFTCKPIFIIYVDIKISYRG